MKIYERHKWINCTMFNVLYSIKLYRYKYNKKDTWYNHNKVHIIELQNYLAYWLREGQINRFKCYAYI